jgi:hypothetical protein
MNVIHNVYLSFTTIPSRAERSYRIIQDLLKENQRDRFFTKLFLCLPDKYISFRENIDHHQRQRIKSLESESFQVLECQDYGPATKIVPVLQHLDGDLNAILVIFDDNCYIFDAFRQIIRKQDKSLDKSFTFYTYMFHGLHVPQGVDLISFWIPNLSDFVPYFKKNVPEQDGCFFVDDLIIAFYLRWKGIPIEELPRKWKWPWIPDCHNISDTVSLFGQQGKHSRDKMMEKCYSSLKQPPH